MKILDNCKLTVQVTPYLTKALNEIAEFAGINENTEAEQVCKTLSAAALLVKCFVAYAKESGCVLLDEESLQVEMGLILERLGGNPQVLTDAPKVNVSAIGQA